MEEEALHQMFAEVVLASFAFTTAFNERGQDSLEAHAANASYNEAMARYKAAIQLIQQDAHWTRYCELNPGSLECKMYDV